ncbi:uncharacterized protein N0V96_010662 [Colletotrichum fioriniae]|uniref:uncharacterized protein n=1 Tax=Colletotrichum fioriniae TaxID=710243 RepID=UPI0032DA97EE|nr:hypothetical protein N0V96_010662 [Colletotrichum fioriniae]
MFTREQEIVGLVAACGQILGAALQTIQQIANALERSKKGFKTLDSVCTHIAITQHILEDIEKVNEAYNGAGVCAAVKMVREAAYNLKVAAEAFGSPSEGRFKTFLNELIRGEARLQRFDRLQVDLVLAQTTLITSLVANNHVRGKDKGKTYITIPILERVENLIGNDAKVNFPSRIFNLLKNHGEAIGDGIICKVKTRDLEMLMQDFLEEISNSGDMTVRVMNHNHVKDEGMMTADIGEPGGGIPQVSKVYAKFNVVSDNGFISAGPASFETVTGMKGVQSALKTLQGDKETAIKLLQSAIPGFNR